MSGRSWRPRRSCRSTDLRHRRCRPRRRGGRRRVRAVPHGRGRDPWGAVWARQPCRRRLHRHRRDPLARVGVRRRRGQEVTGHGLRLRQFGGIETLQCEYDFSRSSWVSETCVQHVFDLPDSVAHSVLVHMQSSGHLGDISAACPRKCAVWSAASGLGSIIGLRNAATRRRSNREFIRAAAHSIGRMRSTKANFASLTDASATSAVCNISGTWLSPVKSPETPTPTRPAASNPPSTSKSAVQMRCLLDDRTSVPGFLDDQVPAWRRRPVA